MLWSKATAYDISNYVNILNDNFNSISISEDFFSYDNCNSIEHRNAIDNLCDSVITSCINASVNCIPTTRSRATHVTGWTDHVKPSNMQFGFKANHSTVMCGLVFHERMNFYFKNGSNVYSCLLDASKAFAKVHYGKLFRILLDKKVPFCIIRLLLDSYIRQQARVL